MPVPSTKSLGLRIFLVEDHPDTRISLERYLTTLGHKVHSVTNMQDALADITSENCELLLCDLGLPDGDGWTLLRALRQKSSQLGSYAVAISGFGTKADLAASDSAGFCQHLIKPLLPEILNQMLADATTVLRRGLLPPTQDDRRR